jgi:hypothetical protein
MRNTIQGRMLLAVAAFLLNGCGEDSQSGSIPQSGNVSLDGTWSLSSVLCDGQPSKVLTPSALDGDAIVSLMTITGNQGSLYYNIVPEMCEINTPLSSVKYPDNNTLQLAKDVPTFSSSCPASFSANAAPAPATNFPFTLSGTTLSITMPPEELARSIDPCGIPYTKVIFNYEKVN